MPDEIELKLVKTHGDLIHRSSAQQGVNSLMNNNFDAQLTHKVFFHKLQGSA